MIYRFHEIQRVNRVYRFRGPKYTLITVIRYIRVRGIFNLVSFLLFSRSFSIFVRFDDARVRVFRLSYRSRRRRGKSRSRSSRRKNKIYNLAIIITTETVLARTSACVLHTRCGRGDAFPGHGVGEKGVGGKTEDFRRTAETAAGRGRGFSVNARARRREGKFNFPPPRKIFRANRFTI